MKALKISVTLSLLIFTGIGRADPLDSWTWRNPLLTGKALHSIAFGSGQFVAVGSAGTIVTSADGRSWAVRQSGTGSNLSGVAYGNGQFVAMGYDDILTSTDGVNWVQSQSGTGWTISGVTYGNGQF